MKSVKRSVMFLGLACLLTAAYAGAGAPDFKKLDKDRDGFISNEESGAAPMVLENFSLLDRNTDGKLSKEEYAALDAASLPSSSGAGGAPGSSAAPGSSGVAP